MKSLVTFGILLLSNAYANDPCSNLSMLNNTNDCSVLGEANCVQTIEPNFLTYTHKARVKIMCDFRETIINQYALLEQKKERINLDSRAHLENCVKIEISERKNDNLKFFDRMKQCIAAFQDTHFSVRPLLSTPTVYTGIILNKINDKFVIGKRFPRILQYVRDRESIKNLMDHLALGNEVIEIDGKKPEELQKHYASFISGSSKAFVQDVAAEDIMFRNYDYPTKSTVDLKIKNSKGELVSVRLPWWSQAITHKRADVNAHFKRIGIISSDRLKFEYNKKKQTWTPVGNEEIEGYDDLKPLLPEKDLTVYKDEDGRSVAWTGINIENSLKSYCYFKLITFSPKTLKKVEPNSEPTKPEEDLVAEAAPATSLQEHFGTFFDPIVDFIKICKEKQLPLILDLRYNEGGVSFYPPKLLSILTEKNKIYPSRAAAFRANQFSGWYLNQILESDLGASELSDFLDYRNFTDLFNRAIENGKPQTDIMQANDIKHDEKVGGYEQKIVALVTPNCISACDVTAALLKSSKRATIIGTHSNGTGAGFATSGGLNLDFKDSYNAITSKIPSYLFGVAKTRTESHILDFQVHNSVMLENTPTEADVKHVTTIDDITGKKNTWLEAASKELFRKDAKKVLNDLINYFK